MKRTQTFNQHVVKKRNKSLLLHSIKDSSPVSRADLANYTGLNKGTVSSLVNELIDEQLILETGPGVSSGGRRPVMLLFNQSAGYSIGIDIGVNYVLAILTDLQGNISNEKLIKTHNPSFEETTEIIFNVIDDLVSTMPDSPYGVVGIGVGVPATVNKAEEIILAPNLNWKNKDLKCIIEEKYNIPVKVKNEANAGAYGEKKFGIGKKFDNIVYISGGIGIGVGLILNGKLYKGNNGFSGELGHMTINMNGPLCNCGNKGCWELYASEKALLEMVSQYGIPMKDGQELSLEFITKLARNGDQKMIELIEQLAEHLAIGINNIINTFNPEQIIIGNRLVTLQSWLDAPLRESMKKNALSTHQKDLQIHFSQLERRSAALGVAAFSTEKFLSINLEEG
ncbi:xylose-responsive transcription regulator [Halalkalibacter wakoensis JCM 9140]|uniref:Xylose-responsive transcription regulator n=1 Tax=Halalkalibacter wakoensis JCM 9140 TaxID=1236970 RepID=W4Q5Y7_9BACI|nr:ROK family protein [Halalkalibacter wakoensis]GAE27375.1 xylose-responsive transcription regulator [Halalkalibacter wakoensis JCM 9140]